MGVVAAFLIGFVIIVIAVAVGIAKGKGITEKNKAACETVKEKLRQSGFTIEKEVVGLLYVDDTKKKWAVKEWNDNTDIKIYDYSDLIDFELIEDNQSIVKGSMGKALVGGALGGTMGAVIGSAGSKKINQKCSLLEVRIRTNDFQKPQYCISLINGLEVPKTSDFYKKNREEAQNLIGVLNYIANNGNVVALEEKSVPEEKESLGTRLRELDQLRKEGLITDEEFELKKKELLNL